MKGDRLIDDLRLAGITGTEITITGRQAGLVTALLDLVTSAPGECGNALNQLAKALLAERTS